MDAKKDRLQIKTQIKRRPIKTIQGNVATIRLYRSEKEKPKLAVLMSKSIAKKAVERNSIKRTILLLTRKHIPYSFIDVLVVPKKTIKEYTKKEIEKELEILLHTK